MLLLLLLLLPPPPQQGNGDLPAIFLFQTIHTYFECIKQRVYRRL
jgi:hypothetical protein